VAELYCHVEGSLRQGTLRPRHLAESLCQLAESLCHLSQLKCRVARSLRHGAL